MATIKQAIHSDIKDIVPLFNAYRIFYGQDHNEAGAFKFLSERLNKKESIILIAYENNIAVGFTQLYPTFSSVSLKATLILNDLFVREESRKTGIAKALLKEAKAYCIKNNYKGLSLETATQNPAQHLYEKLGWKKDVHVFHYFWTAN